MEGNPHQLIEGLILAAYAIEADVAFIFIRGEYKLSQERRGHVRLPKPTRPDIWERTFWSRVTP